MMVAGCCELIISRRVSTPSDHEDSNDSSNVLFINGNDDVIFTRVYLQLFASVGVRHKFT